MQPLNITITDLSLDTVIGSNHHEEPITLADAILDAAVAHLAKDSEYREVYGGLQKRVAQIRDEEIRKRVAAEVESAMAASISLTNQYGERQGATTTLRELIVDEAKKFFTEKRRPGGRYDGPQSTHAEDVVAAYVKDAIQKELAAALVEEKRKVVLAVQAKAAELIAQAVKEGIGR